MGDSGSPLMDRMDASRLRLRQQVESLLGAPAVAQAAQRPVATCGTFADQDSSARGTFGDQDSSALARPEPSRSSSNHGLTLELMNEEMLAPEPAEQHALLQTMLPDELDSASYSDGEDDDALVRTQTRAPHDKGWMQTEHSRTTTIKPGLERGPGGSEQRNSRRPTIHESKSLAASNHQSPAEESAYRPHRGSSTWMEGETREETTNLRDCEPGGKFRPNGNGGGDVEDPPQQSTHPTAAAHPEKGRDMRNWSYRRVECLDPVTQRSRSSKLAQAKQPYSRFSAKDRLRRIRAELVTVRDLVNHHNLHQMYRLIQQVRQYQQSDGREGIAFECGLINALIGEKTAGGCAYPFHCFVVADSQRRRHRRSADSARRVADHSASTAITPESETHSCPIRGNRRWGRCC